MASAKFTDRKHIGETAIFSFWTDHPKRGLDLWSFYFLTGIAAGNENINKQIHKELRKVKEKRLRNHMR